MNYNKFDFGFVPISGVDEFEVDELKDKEDYETIYDFTTTKDFLAHILNQTVPEYGFYSPANIANTMIVQDKNNYLKAEILKGHESIDKVMSKDFIAFSFAVKLPHSQKLMHVNLSILFRKASRAELEKQLNYYDWINYSEYVFYDDLVPMTNYGKYTVEYKYEKHISLVFSLDCPENTPNSIYLSKMVIETASDDYEFEEDFNLTIFNNTEYTILGCVGSEEDEHYEKVFPILRTIFDKSLDYETKKAFLTENYDFKWNDYYTEGLTFLSN